MELAWNYSYLDLLKRMLTRYKFETEPMYLPVQGESWKRRSAINMDRLARRVGLAIVEIKPPTDWTLRERGQDWPVDAETMIGLRRLDQLESAMNEILTNRIEGDFVEAGIWRGGATIFMAACLNVHGITDRVVYAADSFEGLPVPSERYPIDEGDTHHQIAMLSVSRSDVEDNFAKYGVPFQNVVFVEGWFEDTLALIPAEKISLLRMDGDMYSSTIQTLEALYDRVTAGGIVIVDDYSLAGAQAAVHDFLDLRSESVTIVDIDGSGAFWRVPHN
jgi:O-methyltransferase